MTTSHLQVNLKLLKLIDINIITVLLLLDEAEEDLIADHDDHEPAEEEDDGEDLFGDNMEE